MHFCAIERCCNSGRRMMGVHRGHRFPGNRQQMSRPCRLGCFVLPMSARQADCSYLPNVGFFGYFILAHCSRASDDWPIAGVTSVSGKVKVVFFHGILWMVQS